MRMKLLIVSTLILMIFLFGGCDSSRGSSEISSIAPSSSSSISNMSEQEIGDNGTSLPASSSNVALDQSGPSISSSSQQESTNSIMENESYWIEQAEFLAKRLIEYSFSVHELDGIENAQIGKETIEHFVYSFSFWKDEPNDAYLQLVSPARSSDGYFCVLPQDGLSQAIRQCFGQDVSVSDFPKYDPVEKCLYIPVEIGSYHQFEIKEITSELIQEQSIQITALITGDTSFPEPETYGEYQMIFSVIQDADQSYLRFESFVPKQEDVPHPLQ